MTLALDRMRELWEFSPMSAKEIGARFRTTKNSVIGQAHRGGWEPRRQSPGPEPTTIFERLDAINARMEQVLADTRPFVEGRKKMVIADVELLGMES